MLTADNLAAVRRLAKEVGTLARIVQAEHAAEQKRTCFKLRFGPSASKNTAALRRRSMDLMPLSTVMHTPLPTRPADPAGVAPDEPCRECYRAGGVAVVEQLSLLGEG